MKGPAGYHVDHLYTVYDFFSVDLEKEILLDDPIVQVRMRLVEIPLINMIGKLRVKGCEMSITNLLKYVNICILLVRTRPKHYNYCKP